MANLTALARPAVEQLVDKSEDDLYVELARRLRMVQEQPTAAGEFQPPADIKEKVEVETLGFVDDLKAFGRHFFERVNQQAFALLCGSTTAEKAERDKIASSFGLGKEAIAAAIAGALVANLGFAPLIAAGVAVLVIKLFLGPTLQATCDVWKTKLPQPA